MLDTRLRQLHPLHQVLGLLPELRFFLVRRQIQIRDQLTESLLVDLFTILVVPLDDALLVPAVILLGPELLVLNSIEVCFRP